MSKFVMIALLLAMLLPCGLRAPVEVNETPVPDPAVERFLGAWESGDFSAVFRIDGDGIAFRMFRIDENGDSEVWEGMSEDTLTETKIMLDDMHKRKIDMADEIFVINVGGYIGSSTKSEIEYAHANGKLVRYLEESHGSL